MKKFNYRLVDYFDVWGNEEDGFEVNNLCVVEEVKIELDEDSTHQNIIDILKEQNYLKQTVKLSDFDVWDDFEMIEFSDVNNGMPLFRLELVIEY